MNRCLRSLKNRKGSLSVFLNQRRFDVISSELSIDFISITNKSREPSFTPPGGILNLDMVQISGPDLPIFYTTDGSDPDENSPSISSSPTTITLTGLPLTLKARGSVGGVMLSDIISGDFDRNPVREIEPDENIFAEMSIDDISWIEMGFLDENHEESIYTNMNIDEISWQEMNMINEEESEEIFASMSIDEILWQDINIIET